MSAFTDTSAIDSRQADIYMDPCTRNARYRSRVCQVRSCRSDSLQRGYGNSGAVSMKSATNPERHAHCKLFCLLKAINT
jgi:hypothetical protein